NQAENGTPAELGWDYFYGWVGGLPASIDTRAGGAGNGGGSYTCGFVPGSNAIKGACYQPDMSCKDLVQIPSGDSPGLQCLDSGGILVPNGICATAHAKHHFDFERLN